MKLRINKIFIGLALLLYSELMFNWFVFNAWSIKSILFIIVFSFFNALIIDFITSIFGSKFNKWLFILIMGFISVLFISYFINFKFYGNILSIYSIFHGGQVFEFFDQIWNVTLENIWQVVALFIPIPLILIGNKLVGVQKNNWLRFGIKLGFIILLYFGTLLMLNIDKNDIYSAKNLYYYKDAPNQMAQMFGVMTELRIDIKRTITNFEENEIEIGEGGGEIIKEIEYNMEEIDFRALAESEENKTIKTIHEYMASLTPTEKNEFTGMFEGKNLIAIVAEAFSPIAVDPELTPTLYKMVNSSFHFSNFWTPVYYVSTSDGEYVTDLSLLPKSGVWSMKASSKNYLPYAYGNLFKTMGYTTYAFHDHTHSYYGRDKSHPNMGYSYMGCGNGLEKIEGMHCKKWPNSDLEMINATYDMYAHDEHFVTYYMTVSGHLNYNWMGNNMAYKNKSLTTNLSYSEAVRAYISCQIELDRAMEELLKRLEADGKLDDTVIVLSADHYPYGLTNSEIDEVLDIKDEKFDIHQNNLIIYNSAITEPIEVNKIAESLDVLPTVLNLFGAKFDSRLLMGTDLLSNRDGLVIFNDRSWMTEMGKYNAANKVFTPFVDSAKIPEDYVESINKSVSNKFVISKNILDNNYYKYVFPGV